MPIPRRARTLLKQRDIVLKAYASGRITKPQALEALRPLRWNDQGASWVIRADADHAKLIYTAPDGRTEIVVEAPSFLARWWPAIPLVLLSCLALWGFVTSTADEGRVSDDKLTEQTSGPTSGRGTTPAGPQSPSRPSRPTATSQQPVPAMTIQPPETAG